MLTFSTLIFVFLVMVQTQKNILSWIYGYMRDDIQVLNLRFKITLSEHGMSKVNVGASVLNDKEIYNIN